MVNKNIRMSLKKKILLISVSSILLLSLMILIAVYYQTRKTVNKNFSNQLNSNINLGYNLLDNKYPGEWRVVEGNKLFKGAKSLNEDTEFVDEFKKATGLPATIFLGDTRVSTNVLINGKRAIGTKASNEVTSIVLGKGTEYIGEAKVLDNLYTVKYVPIKDKSGKSIGMFFTGVERNSINLELRNLMLTIVLLSIGIIFIIIVGCIVFANSINNNVKTILDSLKLISFGDLTAICKVKSKDEISEIAENLNTTVANVRNLIYEIKHRSESLQQNSEILSATSEEMSSSSESVASAIQDVKNGTGSQADDLSNITNILGQFGEDLESIVQAIKHIDKNSRGITSLANNNNNNMEVLIESIRKISVSFNDFTSKMENLTQNISHINEITILINNISNQTNLLALNAAIEAARAGEEGKGFAVVAEEVRKLAEQSKTSSEEINSLITNISTETNTITKTFKVISDELNSQIDNTNRTIDSFKKITKAVDEIIPQINLVNSSAINVNSEKNLIIEKIQEVSSTAEEVSASSEEIAAASEEMNSSSQEVALSAEGLSNFTKEMMSQVNKFKV